MPPCNMSWPANTNSGIASSVDESVPAAVSMTNTSAGNPRYNSVSSEALSNATATETPTTKSSANVPNKMARPTSASSSAAQAFQSEQRHQGAADDEGQKVQAGR